MKICIVTPDLAGPVSNGGIGTHAALLARFLKRDLGHEVTILLTAEFTIGDRRQRCASWTDGDIPLVHLAQEEAEQAVVLQPGFPSLQRAERVRSWLAKRDFDVVHFQDWSPDASLAVQAKRTGTAFARTVLTLTLHSPHEWAREGMHEMAEGTLDGLLLDALERYGARHADMLFTPTQAMFNWAESAGWRLAAARRVLPLLVEIPDQPAGTAPGSFAGGHFVFFGRLETRKGLSLFIEALRCLAPEWRKAGLRKRVTFLGNIHRLHGKPADEEVRSRLAEAVDVLDIEMHTTWGRDRALGWLAGHRDALVVVPSLQDNSPYTVLECLHLGLPLLATAVGGIPELVDATDVLCEPDRDSLAAALRKAAGGGWRTARPRVDRPGIREMWRGVHEEIAKGAGQPPAPPAGRPPRISVCVTHHNYGRYLTGALEALEGQDWPDMEVIVVDDGSSEPDSRRVFEDCRRRWEPAGWKFIATENRYVGAARNMAAREASGDYLLWVDADNVPGPRMVRTLAEAAVRTGDDCLTCHFWRVRSGEVDIAPGTPRERIVMPGDCREAGLFEDVFGDTNFLVRRELFLRTGGFVEERNVCCEDWEFLGRLLGAGGSLDAVPEPLFTYRDHGGGINRTRDEQAGRRRAMRAMTAKLPDWERRALEHAVGAYLRFERENRIRRNDPYVYRDLRSFLLKIGAAITRWHAAHPRLQKALDWCFDRISGKKSGGRR